MSQWSILASAMVLAALGWWTYRHRRADHWVLIGVAAIIARFWIFHSVYDDVLIIFPEIALFRIAKHDRNLNWAALAGLLLAVNIPAMLFLASWQLLPAPWHWIFIGGHTAIWFTDLIFLIACARRDENISLVETSA